MEHKFTRGNWNISRHANNESYGIYSALTVSCQDHVIVKGADLEEAAANAKLIAAAPKLLKALEMFIEATSFRGEMPRRTTINVQLHTSAICEAEAAIRSLE